MTRDQRPLATQSNRPGRRRILIPLAVLVLSLLVIVFGRVVIAAGRLERDAQSLQEMSARGLLSASSPNLSGELEAQLSQTIQDFRDLRASVGWLAWLGPALGWVPRYGGDLSNAPALLNFGDHLADSAQGLLAVSRAMNAAIETGRASGTPIGVSVLRAAQSQSAPIQAARQSLDAAIRARTQIDSARLSPSLQNGLARFDAWQPLLQASVEGLAAAPTLLGADRPRVYLLVAQNDDELRATGGFITGVALLKIDQGQIAVGDFKDSYSVDNLDQPHPAAPAPLQQYMYAYYWTFRDGNWSPDFPTAAKQLETLYQIDRGIAADGVIAVNQKLLPRLLDALGPVTLDAYNETVNANNALAKIHEYWASPQGIGQPPDWWEHRKDFIGNLFAAMMHRLTTGDLDRVRLASALLEGVMTKDLLIYVNDAGAGDAASLSQMDALFAGSGDAVMLVDSNVGFNKVDGNVQRQVDYAVDLDESGSVQATVTITYSNASPSDGSFCVHAPIFPTRYSELQQGCYWDYVRLIVPPKAELVDASRDLGASAETLPDGHTSLGGYFFVGRGEQRTIRFAYRVPSLLRPGSAYTLRLEKQPGSPTTPFIVRVTLPADSQVEFASPPPKRTIANTVEFAVTLDRDQEIRLGFSPSPRLPYDFVTVVLSLGGAVIVLAILRRRKRFVRESARIAAKRN